MKWFTKLFIPKREQHIVSIVDNATKIHDFDGNRNFLDDRGNGVRLHGEAIVFLVDKSPVHEWGHHYVSFPLQKYMYAVFNEANKAAENAYQKVKKAKDAEAFSNALSKFNSKTVKLDDIPEG